MVCCLTLERPGWWSRAARWLEAAQGQEDLSFVWEAVKQLPPEQSACIHLFYYEGYPTRDVARMLGRKESTIRSDLRRGREKLKGLLKEAYDFEGTV